MLTLRIIPTNGEPFEVTADSRDVYVWEKTSRGSNFRTAMESASIVAMYELAHLASRRQGLYTGSLAEMTADCRIENAEEDETDEEAPFPPEASGETSSRSPSSPASPPTSGRKKASGR